MPPNALDTEEIVLGQLMLEEDAVLNVVDTLKPTSFYKEAHQKIYKAIVDIALREDPVNMISVIEELRKHEQLEAVGGAYFISQLTAKVSTAAHVEYHAKLIAQKAIQRDLIKFATEIHNKSYDATMDVADLIDYSEQALFKITEGNIKKESASINVVMEEAFKRIEEAAARPDGLSGVPSGFSGLDAMTSGWQPSDMIVIAARPAMGKTAFILSMMRNMAVDHNQPVAMFSLEMPNVQLVTRLIVSETQLDHDKVKNGRLTPKEWKDLEEKTRKLAASPIYLDDTPALSIFEFRAKCRRLKQKYDIKMVFIDYLQLMTSSGSMSREQEVSTISRQIKAIAKELNVPIIALSQLNRSVETRGGDKRPQLSDLRESGAIEQDADMVSFIHRPEYYGITEDEEGNNLKGLAEIIIAKHRNGSVGSVYLQFKKEFARFCDLEDNQIDDFNEAIAVDVKAITLGSKMNEDQSPKETTETPPAANPFDDISANTDFDNEAPF